MLVSFQSCALFFFFFCLTGENNRAFERAKGERWPGETRRNRILSKGEQRPQRKGQCSTGWAHGERGESGDVKAPHPQFCKHCICWSWFNLRSLGTYSVVWRLGEHGCLPLRRLPQIQGRRFQCLPSSKMSLGIFTTQRAGQCAL